MLDFDFFTAGLVPSMLMAAMAGGLSFLSPCVLPIVPPYLAYMSGLSMADLREGRGRGRGRLRLLLPALFFVLGLSTVFLILGFAASTLGVIFLQYQDWLAKASGLFVIVLGLHFLGLFRIPLLDREARMEAGDQGGSAFGAYLLGLAFAFGWTPCIGPQLSGILALAAGEANVARGTFLLAVYALGLGVPFLLAALFIERAMGLMTRLKRHMRLIERLMGVLLIVVGLALLTGALSAFSYFLLDRFPALNAFG